MIQRVIYESDKRIHIEYVGGRKIKLSSDEGGSMQICCDLLMLGRLEVKEIVRTEEWSFVVTFHDSLSLEFFTPGKACDEAVRAFVDYTTRLKEMEDTMVLEAA